MSKRSPSPTTRQYSAFQHAYAVFNSELFGDTLPDCLITMQRQAHCCGYFSADQFTSPNGQATTDEIASTRNISPRMGFCMACKPWCMRWYISGSITTASRAGGAITMPNGPRRWRA